MTDVARQTLSGNDTHSPASANALKYATSIFLNGNELRWQDAHFWSSFARPYEGTKSRFLVAWLLGMTIAGVEVDEPRQRRRLTSVRAKAARTGGEL